MRKLNVFSVIFVSLLACTGCSLEDPIESSVTKYAQIEYSKTLVVPLGGTFTPDAVATIDGEEIEVTVEGNPDTETVGVYDIFYSAENADGFEAKVVQKVVVHDPHIVGADVTGSFWDQNNHSRTGVIELIEGTTSIFRASDFGFAGTFPVYFQMNGNEIDEIPQNYPLDASDVDLSYDSQKKIFTVLIHPSGFSYTFEYTN